MYDTCTILLITYIQTESKIYQKHTAFKINTD